MFAVRPPYACVLADHAFGNQPVYVAARANGGGTAFFAHVGGFLFGVLVAGLLSRSGVIEPTSGTPLAAGSMP